MTLMKSYTVHLPSIKCTEREKTIRIYSKYILDRFSLYTDNHLVMSPQHLFIDCS